MYMYLQSLRGEERKTAMKMREENSHKQLSVFKIKKKNLMKTK